MSLTKIACSYVEFDMQIRTSWILQLSVERMDASILIFGNEWWNEEIKNSDMIDVGPEWPKIKVGEKSKQVSINEKSRKKGGAKFLLNSQTYMPLKRDAFYP